MSDAIHLLNSLVELLDDRLLLNLLRHVLLLREDVLPLLLLDVALEFAQDGRELLLYRVVVADDLLEFFHELGFLRLESFQLLFKILEFLLLINCLCAFGFLFFSQLLDDRIGDLNGVYLLLHHGVEIQIAYQLLF